jgi:hypothetical protein
MFTAHRQLAVMLAAAGLLSSAPRSSSQEVPDIEPLPAAVQLPSGAVIVTYQDGELTIEAKNAPLARILQVACNQIGAIIDVPSGGDETVAGEFGPGGPSAVIAALLNGSRFNYVMTASEGDPNRLERVVLSLRHDARENSPPQEFSKSSSTPTPEKQVVTTTAASNETTDLLSPEQLRTQVNDLLAQAGAQQADAKNSGDVAGLQQLQSVMEATLARASALAKIDKAIEESTPERAPLANSAAVPGSNPDGDAVAPSRMKRKRR